MPSKKPRIEYDGDGGVIRMQRRLLSSPAYLALSPQAKALLHLMHQHWRYTEPVAFGVREAQRLIPCSRKKAMRCFNDLQDGGFIKLVDESLFCSRTQSKARTWRLTWMPFVGVGYTNDWEKRHAA